MVTDVRIQLTLTFINFRPQGHLAFSKGWEQDGGGIQNGGGNLRTYKIDLVINYSHTLTQPRIQALFSVPSTGRSAEKSLGTRLTLIL